MLRYAWVPSTTVYPYRVIGVNSTSTILLCNTDTLAETSAVNPLSLSYTINTFKNRLDKFWSDQEVLYDYNADLHGIGNRSLL